MTNIGKATLLRMKYFRSSGTWEKPSDVGSILVIAVGGGGTQSTNSGTIGKGGDTIFSTMVAGGGVNSYISTTTATGGDLNFPGTTVGLGGYARQDGYFAWGYQGPGQPDTGWTGGNGSTCQKYFGEDIIPSSVIYTVGAGGSPQSTSYTAGFAGAIIIYEFGYSKG